MKLLLVAGWFLSSLGIMLYFGIKDIRSFDPDGKLHFASTDLNYDTVTKQVFNATFSELKGVAFHIQDQSCSCSSFSKEHIRSLDIKFEKAGFSTKKLTPSSHREIVSLFPSLPALAIFDENAELAYLGPYSSGLFCSKNSSLIETIVDSIISNSHLGSLVISDSSGCYCDITI